MNENEKIPYVVSSKSYTAVAINCAAKAGEWIKSKLGTVKQLSTKSSAQDIVTEVDKGAEQMIRKLILTHFPDHAILGEEGVAPGTDAYAKALGKLKTKSISGLSILWTARRTMFTDFRFTPYPSRWLIMEK